MIFKRERDFRVYVLDVAKEAGFHTTHVESPTTSAGVPDLNLFKGADIWIELKVWHELRGVRMRPTQKRWHKDRHEANGLSWVLVHHEGRMSLIPGDIAAGLTAKNLTWQQGCLQSTAIELELILDYCQREVIRRQLTLF